MSPWIERLKKVREEVIPFAGWEMMAMRLLFAVVIFFAMLPADRAPFATMPLPNGIAHFLDLTFLADPAAWSVLRWGAAVALVAYVLGRFTLPATIYLSLLLVALGTLRNSQGANDHSTQLATLVMCAQAALCAWDLARSRVGLDRIARQRRMMHAARVMIAAVYLTTAVTKLIRSEGSWLKDTPNLSVQIVKAYANQYYDSLAPMDTFRAETVPNFIAAHPNVSRVFFAPGLLVEFFLFLGLIGRKWSLIIGLAAVGMHQMISLVMALHFPLHEALMWIFYVNVPYWGYRAAAWIQRRKPLSGVGAAPQTT